MQRCRSVALRPRRIAQMKAALESPRRGLSLGWIPPLTWDSKGTVSTRYLATPAILTSLLKLRSPQRRPLTNFPFGDESPDCEIADQRGDRRAWIEPVCTARPKGLVLGGDCQITGNSDDFVRRADERLFIFTGSPDRLRKARQRPSVEGQPCAYRQWPWGERLPMPTNGCPSL
jgi:hypothetical protein